MVLKSFLVMTMLFGSMATSGPTDDPFYQPPGSCAPPPGGGDIGDINLDSSKSFRRAQAQSCDGGVPAQPVAEESLAGYLADQLTVVAPPSYVKPIRELYYLQRRSINARLVSVDGGGTGDVVYYPDDTAAVSNGGQQIVQKNYVTGHNEFVNSSAVAWKVDYDSSGKIINSASNRVVTLSSSAVGVEYNGVLQQTCADKYGVFSSGNCFAYPSSGIQRRDVAQCGFWQWLFFTPPYQWFYCWMNGVGGGR